MNSACLVGVHSPFCITPPHILLAISKRGDEKQKAWAVRTLSISEQFTASRELVRAKVVLAAVAIVGRKQRVVYDANNTTNLPGTLVRDEGDPPTTDVAVNEAYDGAGETYDFYMNVFKRNSIDNMGMRLDLTIHYDQKFDNARWNGSQMIFGDGDGIAFQRFTKSVDIIAHELTHGVNQYEARLVYWEQSGALNEHMSDVFGSLVKQYSLKQTADRADWLIGEGLFTPAVNGKALRSMKEPGTAYDDPLIDKDPQPAHMKDYMEVDYDYGGVHINSGIPNHAFYLTAVEIGGNAWEKAGKIWYDTFRNKKLKSRSKFQEFADLAFEVAGGLFGAGSKEQQAVQKGWHGVGITVK